MDQIEEHLYLGNIKAASDDAFLKKYNITCIVEIHDAYRNKKRIPGAEYCTMQFDDRNFVDIKPYIQIANKFIDEKIKQKKSVLVHCSGGVSRSAAIVIGYLIFKGSTFEEAFKLVRRKRSVVDMNYGFRDQLIEFEKQCVKGNAGLDVQ